MTARSSDESSKRLAERLLVEQLTVPFVDVEEDPQRPTPDLRATQGQARVAEVKRLTVEEHRKLREPCLSSLKERFGSSRLGGAESSWV